MKKCRILKRLCIGLAAMVWSAVFLLPMAASAEEGEETAAGLELTAEERKFIEEKGTVTIACQTDNCPLLYQDEKTGEIRGITIDILDMVSEATGLTFVYQALPLGSVTYADLQRLQVDMVASVECNEINQQSGGIVLTEPYLHAEKVFVCKKGVLFEPEGDMTVAVASGSQTLAKIIQKIYPRFQVEFYGSTEEALLAVLRGEADAALQNQYTIDRILAKPQYEDLQVVATASIGDSHCLAGLVPVGEEKRSLTDGGDTALLISVLNKGIESLDKGSVSFAIIKETAENTYQFTMWDMLYRYGYAVMLVTGSLLLIIILLRRNHILQKKRSEQLMAEQRARELAAVNGHMHEQQILLMDALERAEEGNRAKTSFLFNMSHDMRTPMSAILGFTEIAYQNRDNREKLTDCLKKIQESGDHLLQLINGILEMSRIENGKVILTEDSCNLVEIIKKVSDILQVETDKKNLTVRLDVSRVRDEWVCCDHLRVNQILFNLLSNAAKFSRTGGSIDITLAQKQSDMKEYGIYELRVKDTGIGMSQEFLAHIFEPFEREHTSTVSKTQGTGLGMAITKNLVDLMGGTMEVFSEVDKGTEFVLCFTFKLQENMQKSEEKPKEEAPSEVDFRGKRLLLVEDNELNREIAQDFLLEEGFIIETAENGRVAVDMVKDSEPGYYDAILMDIQMPVMDGYEATRQIRKLDNKELAALPVIAVTANAFDEDKKEALASGMNAHTAKPIDISLLCRVLKEVLNL